MQTVESKILSRIYGHGKGWSFTKVDFIASFDEVNVRKALSTLTRAGTIRRVCRGAYDYPRYSPLLEQPLSPDIDQVAQALARKFNWRIMPSGEAALNLLGLSTQVPGRWVYLSDGPNRDYPIGEAGQQTLQFRKASLKDTGFKHRHSGILVHALKALGKARIDDTVIKKLRPRFDTTARRQILNDTITVTGWVRQAIRKICEAPD